MAEGRSDLGLTARSWNAAKIYGGSNTVARYGAIVESESLQTLANYVRNLGLGRQIETRGMDFDTKDDDRLKKYNIVKITPTRHLEEVDSPLEMYLITDIHGHDIGTYEITDKGPVFKLSPKIEKYNNKIIKEFSGQAQEVLKERFSINTFEDLVDKLSKGEDIALYSEDQAKDEIVKNSPTGSSYEVEEKQDPEEKKALAKAPADMRGQIVELARQRGIKIKEILIVNNPTQLSKKLDDNRKNQISLNGGPVILIRAKSRKSK